MFTETIISTVHLSPVALIKRGFRDPKIINQIAIKTYGTNYTTTNTIRITWKTSQGLLLNGIYSELASKLKNSYELFSPSAPWFFLYHVDLVASGVYARCVDIPKALGLNKISKLAEEAFHIKNPYEILSRIYGKAEKAELLKAITVPSSANKLDEFVEGLGKIVQDKIAGHGFVTSKDVGHLILHHVCLRLIKLLGELVLTKKISNIVEITNDSFVVETTEELDNELQRTGWFGKSMRVLRKTGGPATSWETAGPPAKGGAEHL